MDRTGPNRWPFIDQPPFVHSNTAAHTLQPRSIHCTRTISHSHTPLRSTGALLRRGHTHLPGRRRGGSVSRRHAATHAAHSHAHTCCCARIVESCDLHSSRGGGRVQMQMQMHAGGGGGDWRDDGHVDCPSILQQRCLSRGDSTSCSPSNQRHGRWQRGDACRLFPNFGASCRCNRVCGCGGDWQPSSPIHASSPQPLRPSTRGVRPAWRASIR